MGVTQNKILLRASNEFQSILEYSPLIQVIYHNVLNSQL